MHLRTNPDPSIPGETLGLLVERVRLWSGLDRDCEWFDVGAIGAIDAGVPGATMRFDRGSVVASCLEDEVRLRVVTRIGPAGAVLLVRSRLAPDAMVVVRDAFSTELAQAIGGTGELRLPLALGRYSIDAMLQPGSRIEISDDASAAVRVRVSGEGAAGA